MHVATRCPATLRRSRRALTLAAGVAQLVLVSPACAHVSQVHFLHRSSGGGGGGAWCALGTLRVCEPGGGWDGREGGRGRRGRQGGGSTVWYGSATRRCSSVALGYGSVAPACDACCPAARRNTAAARRASATQPPTLGGKRLEEALGDCKQRPVVLAHDGGGRLQQLGCTGRGRGGSETGGR